MFRRGWFGLGRLRSDEGFSIAYGHKALRYFDEHGEVQAGFEDGYLFPDIFRVGTPLMRITGPDRDKILDRMVRALEWDGQSVQVWDGAKASE